MPSEMPFQVPADYWLEIPAGRYRLGVTRDEARTLAHESAAWADYEGFTESLNESTNRRRAAELTRTAANPEWIERYLLEHFPAREVDLPAYAIARMPITSGEYREFMTDTGETDGPSAWEIDEANRGTMVPAAGIRWGPATALAAWAGARLPFADEWECAVRTRDHRLFPWGNELKPIGWRVLSEGYPRVLPAALTRNSDGLEAACAGNHEWCADYANDDRGRPWGRAVCGSVEAKVVPSAVTRASRDPFAGSERGMVRLVRADGRAIPPTHPSIPDDSRANEVVRVFESRVVLRVIEELRQSPLAEEHRLKSHAQAGFYDEDPAVKRVAVFGQGDDGRGLRLGMKAGPSVWCYGRTLVAISRETIRRIPPEHGVFAWHVDYRLANDGSVRARPVMAFRRAFDRRLQRFVNQFCPEEPDTALSALTPAMIRTSIVDAFRFYELHSDL